MKKYLYIATNPDYPSTVKIGVTKNPKQRTVTLNSNSVKRFKLEVIIEIEDAHNAEKFIHKKLNKFHSDREFYEISCEKAEQRIRKHLKNFKPKLYPQLQGMKLGQQIKERRRELNLTLEEVARFSGLQEPQLSRIENNKQNPSLETIYRVLRVLNVKIVLQKGCPD